MKSAHSADGWFSHLFTCQCVVVISWEKIHKFTLTFSFWTLFWWEMYSQLTSLLLLLILLVVSVKSDADVLFMNVGQDFNHGPLFKGSNDQKLNPTFVAETEVNAEPDQKQNKPSSLLQHGQFSPDRVRRMVPALALRIGPDRLRQLSITVRQTLRIV